MSLRKYSSQPRQQTLPLMSSIECNPLSLFPRAPNLSGHRLRRFLVNNYVLPWHPERQRLSSNFSSSKNSETANASPSNPQETDLDNSMQLLYCHGSESNLYKWRVFVPYYPLNPLTNKILFIFSMNWSKKIVKKRSLVVI